MGAVVLIARSRLRANLVATLLLVVLAGLGGGTVMASVAGIRRADGAWQQVQEDNPAGDALVAFLGADGSPVSSVEDDQADEVREVAATPGVISATRATAVVGVVGAADGSAGAPIAASAYLDGLAGELVGRPIPVEGRMPDPDAASEVAVDEQLADRLGVGAGDDLSLTPFLLDELEAASDGRDDEPGGEARVMTVVGVVRQPQDLLPPRTSQFALYSDEPFLLLTPAWWTATGPAVGNYGILILVDLEPSVDLTDFAAAMSARFGESTVVVPATDEVGIPEEVRQAVQRQIAAEGRAVTAFAIAVALAATVMFGLALARQLGAEGADRDALQSLGVTQRGLVGADVLRSLTVAVGAAAIAAAVAVGLSPWLPIGVGGRTVGDRGVDVDATVLLVGSAGVVGMVLLVAWLAGWRQAADRRPATSISIADRVARLGAPPPVTLGVHMAFDRSPAAVAGRGAVAIVGLAVAVVLAAATLLGSFDQLRSEPARLGQVWDASAGNFASSEGLEAGLASLAAMDGIDAVAGERGSTATIAGREVSLVAYQPFSGELVPALVEGRAPRAVDEVALGVTLARSLAVDVGDQIPVRTDTADRPTELTVTGIGPVGAMGFEVDPGASALVSPDLLAEDPDSGASVLLVRFVEDADHAAVLAELRRRFPLTVLAAPVPSRSVQTLAGLTGLPIALSATVAVLALAAAANAALSSVRHRRRELAVCKVLGLRRAQVRQVVAWQAVAWAAVAVVVGLPLGVLLGSVGWQAVLRSLGLDSPLSIPTLMIALLVVAVPVVLLALTWLPARRAAAASPALTLRSE